jgi:carboxyl-terminal processing protease
MKPVTKIIVAAFAGLILSLSVAFTPDYFEISKQLDIFTTIFKEVNLYYVDETQPGKLMDEAIESMLSSLDPYTNYIPEEMVEDYKIQTTGH